MGPSNPRQLCGKTHCPFLDLDVEPAWDFDAGTAYNDGTQGGGGESDAHVVVAVCVHSENDEPSAAAPVSRIDGDLQAAAAAASVAVSGQAKARFSTKRSLSHMLSYGASAPIMRPVGGDDLRIATLGAVKRMRLASSALAQAAGEFDNAVAEVELALRSPFFTP